MFLCKVWLFITVCLGVLSNTLSAQITVQGVVSDTDAAPVAGALVELIDQADSSRVFSNITNGQGHYSIQITTTDTGDLPEHTPNKYSLLQNYPNPFNPSTVICYEIPHPAHVRIEIHNVLGQKIRTLYDGYQMNLYNQVIWYGTNDQNLGVAAGVYIYSLITDDCRINRKMLLLDGHLGKVGKISGNALHAGQPGLSKTASNIFMLRITGLDIETYIQQDVQIIANIALDFTINRITLTDIDGRKYKIVKIGEQWWLAENLKVSHYRNGDPIPNVSNRTNWQHLKTGAYCYHPNYDSTTVGDKILYNWYAVTDKRCIAPAGWHVSTDSDWQTLVDYLGGEDVAGGALKDSGTAYWRSPNTGATNSSGFTARPNGYRDGYGWYSVGQHEVRFWAITEDNFNLAWCRVLGYDHSRVIRTNPQSGLSVRLVRDYQTPPNSPKLISPANGANGTSTVLDLQWNPSTNANFYNLQVATDSGFTNLLYEQSGLLTTTFHVYGLDEGTTFYWRVNAAHSGGVSNWSKVCNFTTWTLERGSVTDFDSNVYMTVKIGNQWWMAQNLRVTHYRNGDPIPNIIANDEWGNLTTGAFCYYDNNNNFMIEYGALYNWYAVKDSRNIAPAGWHVPTDAEWQILVDYLGGDEVAGGKLKEIGTLHWNSPNDESTNESGFTALPGGLHDSYGRFSGMGSSADFWSATQYNINIDNAWHRELYYDYPGVYRSYYLDKHSGFSVRLVRD